MNRHLDSVIQCKNIVAKYKTQSSTDLYFYHPVKNRFINNKK